MTTQQDPKTITDAKVVDTYMATDPEITGAATCVMASCTWSVSGTDALDFAISNEVDTFGALTFKETPNYEMPADSNTDNVYMVTVVVTDMGVDDKNEMTADAGRGHHHHERGRRRDGHPIVGAAQGRNRADRHPGGP